MSSACLACSAITESICWMMFTHASIERIAVTIPTVFPSLCATFAVAIRSWGIFHNGTMSKPCSSGSSVISDWLKFCDAMKK